MNSEKFNEVVLERIDTCLAVLCSKGEEYATEDKLHNFKVAAELQNCTPISALAGMMAKHTVSVYDLVKKHEQGLDVSADMWNEKIGDSINYLLLPTALIVEDKDTNGVEDAVNEN